VRVVIAEDLALLRDGLTRLLEAYDFEVVAAVDDAVKLAEALRTLDVDIAVVDVRMPPTFTDEGLRAAIEARAERPGLPVLVLSQYVEQLYARELLSSGDGAVGYLLKDRVAEVGEFLEALDRVAAGRAAFDPEVVRQLLARTSHTDPLGRLTPREAEVLDRMAQGHTNAGIAAHLHVSQSAVEKHVNAIFDKLDLSHTTGYSRRILAVLHYLGS
jgi:DNA-binding NarL/FixJ family response regulator